MLENKINVHFLGILTSDEIINYFAFFSSIVLFRWMGKKRETVGILCPLKVIQPFGRFVSFLCKWIQFVRFFRCRCAVQCVNYDWHHAYDCDGEYKKPDANKKSSSFVRFFFHIWFWLGLVWLKPWCDAKYTQRKR